MEKESFLETKVRNLESKIIRLEEKVDLQERRLHNLTEQLAVAELELSKIVESSDGNNNQQKNSIYRTCHEAHTADPSLETGMHWIDPDGNGFGNEPIRVHCNMTTGKIIAACWLKAVLCHLWLLSGATSILHDSESETDVGRCAKRGCYSKKINYDVKSSRQIDVLIELSDECHQSIKVRFIIQQLVLQFEFKLYTN